MQVLFVNVKIAALFSAVAIAMPHLEITVIGAGVIGLHTARQLQDAGHHVTIISKDPLDQTTSNAAAAFWMPYKVEPEAFMLAWAKDSLPVFKALAQDPDSGVVWRPHTEYFQQPVTRPAWMNLLPRCESNTLLTTQEWPYHQSAYLPQIDTPKHIQFIAKRFIEHGGKLQCGIEVTDLNTIESTLLVNCTGIGAAALVADTDLRAYQGQVTRVTQPTPNITESALFVDGDDALVIVPHHDHVAIGVTVRPNNPSSDFDAVAEQYYLAQAYQYYPQLQHSTVLTRHVGHRPVRPKGVRLEAETLASGKTVIHHYGHGGGGVTLAPGCALAVRRLVETLSL